MRQNICGKKEKTFCIRAKHDPLIPIHNLIKHVLSGLFEVEFMPLDSPWKSFSSGRQKEKSLG